MTGQGKCSFFVLMLAKYRPWRDGPLFKISAAAGNDSLIKAYCPACPPARWYHPDDLITLYGDIPVASLHTKMRCGRCRNSMRVDIETPSAAERQKIRVRRLNRVWWVRRASWRYEGC